ncbi:DnaB-like helicase (plasmid) [Trichormus variabilis ATCC 29413]|uniref:DNA 5'-3' helicase n=2 Tax=Anabaena variabilis TaxID=264691 RepID=Q3M1U8_TRIV2|nr:MULTISPECIES: DnaB-like helicase C-terminal domain-containing protein [Nostocaceae]ABA25038.1 DnaB-like helicase [Trichormus variabilis ATCC 29413]MBC1217928.1 AAA family ATPase [Trichormus variabilis ARAD]MBC1259124.1 AAA family ATPase [Trichormus variabilis V5]MBC1270675.1 AAA family ATPase [Trichormus variabilis FSR]MBC1305525.1 AAA family ATPase [Trichormus variabilis N2B]
MHFNHDNVIPFSASQDVDRLPPQSIEAEESVLGGIMIDPQAFDRISHILVPEAFYVSAHTIIYQAFTQLRASFQPTDLLCLTNWLMDHNLLERIGGRNKLATLFDRTVSAVNIDVLADLVMQKYRRRQLIKIGNEIMQLGYETQTDLGQIFSQAEQKVFRVTQNSSDEQCKVHQAADMAIELYQKLEMGQMQGDKFGWYDLEAITGGLYPSSLVVVAAESHMGKTHFMISTAYEIMTKLGKGVLYVTPEMDRSQVNARMLARITGVDSAHIQAQTQSYWQQVAQGVCQLAEMPWQIFEHSSPTPTMIASAVRRSIAEAGGSLGAVFVDYLQQIPLEGGGNMAHEVGKITRQIRAIAKEHKIPVFLGCQINRGNQTTADKRPNRHLLRNSGEIFEVCDQLIMLYRDAVYTKDPSDQTIELIVEKNRLYGKLGTATMLCDFSTSRFLNFAR